MKTNEIVQPRYSGPEGTPIHREIAHGVGYFASMSLGLV